MKFKCTTPDHVTSKWWQKFALRPSSLQGSFRDNMLAVHVILSVMELMKLLKPINLGPELLKWGKTGFILSVIQNESHEMFCKSK